MIDREDLGFQRRWQDTREVQEGRVEDTCLLSHQSYSALNGHCNEALKRVTGGSLWFAQKDPLDLGLSRASADRLPKNDIVRATTVVSDWLPPSPLYRDPDHVMTAS